MKINYYCEKAHENAESKGFWDDIDLTRPRDIVSVLALIGTEVSEAIEAVRDPSHEDSLREELADICIRVFDICGALDIDLEQAILDKMTENAVRSRMHGKRL